MKAVKTCGLLAVIVVFVLALLGPSMAMGESTSLCNADEESECASPVSHVHYTSGNMTVVTSVMTYECSALLLADAGELGAPQILKGAYTYTSCNQGCTRTEENGPAVLNFLKTGHESGEATGESLVHVSCGSTINCTYTLKGMIAAIKGPLLSTETNGELTFTEQTMVHESGLFCPKEAHLTVKFTPLSATYISS